MGFITVSIQVLIMFSLMGAGYGASRFGILSTATARDMTAILVTFVSPCLIIKAFARPFSAEKAHTLFLSVAIYLLITAIFVLLSWLFYNRRTVVDLGKRAQLQFSFVYSNMGFLGIPLLMALFGDDGVFYGATLMAATNLFIWTHGFGIMQGGKPTGNPFLKIIANPNILALFVGLSIYLAQITLPAPLLQFTGYMADLNTPLSMLVIGNSIASIPLRGIFTDGSVWLLSVLRNLVAPLLTIGILLLFPTGTITNLASLVIIVMMACPVAANAVMFSKFCGLPESYPTKLVTLSTLLSAATIPLVVSVSLRFFPLA